MFRPTLSTVSIASISIALSATATLALPTDMGRSADVYTNAIRYFEARSAQQTVAPVLVAAEQAPTVLTAEEKMFKTSLVARDLATVDFAGALEEEAYKVSLVPQALTSNELENALEREVFKVALDVAHPARLAMMQAREDKLFRSGLEPQVLSEATVESALEYEVFKVALDSTVAPSLDVAQIKEDEAYEIALEPHVLSDTEIQNALEYEVFKVALDQDSPVRPLLRTTTPDDVFAVSLEPRSLQSLDVPEELLTPAFIAKLDAEASNEDAVIVPATFGTAPATATAGSSRVAEPAEADVTPASVVVSEAPDLMDQMAAADGNLTIREGSDGRADTMMMSSDVLFSFGKATLAAEAEATLETMIAMLETESTVRVYGHTDAIGSEDNNLVLGQRRAETVRAWLLDNSNLSPEKVVAIGVGEVDPIALNISADGQDNPEGRALNRRVEFAFE